MYLLVVFVNLHSYGVTSAITTLVRDGENEALSIPVVKSACVSTLCVNQQ